MVPEDLSQRVLDEIDPEALASDCLEFVAVKSETGSEGPGAEFFADLLSNSGLDVALDEVKPDRPNASALLRGSGGGPSLLLNGHVDTIPIGRCTRPDRDGDWITGRGTEDMKGGLTAMVHAVRAIVRSGGRLRADLWLTGMVGHEAPVGNKEGPRRLVPADQ